MPPTTLSVSLAQLSFSILAGTPLRNALAIEKAIFCGWAELLQTGIIIRNIICSFVWQRMDFFCSKFFLPLFAPSSVSHIINKKQLQQPTGQMSDQIQLEPFVFAMYLLMLYPATNDLSAAIVVDRHHRGTL